MLKKLALYGLILSGVLALTGCATVADMPLNAEKAQIDTSAQSILTARLRVRNVHHDSQQPKVINVMTSDSKDVFAFVDATLVEEKPDGEKDYLISFSAPPGKIRLECARVLRSVPLLLQALGRVPFNYDIDVPANKIVYLGNFDAQIVARENDSQSRAGGILPLIDQAVAGFSNGTVVVKVTDQYDADVAEMRKRFPSLGDRTIDKMVLPAWDPAVNTDRAGGPCET